MSTPPVQNLDTLQVADEQLWHEGPPHELFRELRAQCPVHWSAGIAQSPQDAGFWSVTKAEDVFTVSRDWETFSSASNILITDYSVPVDLIQGVDEEGEFVPPDLALDQAPN